MNFSLTTEESAGYTADTTIWGIYNRLLASGRTSWGEMNESEVSAIATIAESFATMPQGDHANGLLAYYHRDWRVLCVYRAIGPHSKRTNPAGNNEKTVDTLKALFNATGAQVKVYPNPARDIVVFDYNVPHANNDLKVTITNMTGQRIQVIYLANTHGKTQWTTQDVPNGIYYYQVSDSKTSFGSGKIVILK